MANRGHVEFAAAIEAHAVCPAPDRKCAAHVTMTAAEKHLKDPEQRVHRSRSRPRSELPLASSHASRERILARAKAIELSAAP